jgi:LPXTG-motif cell wall-anchored protein
MRGITSGRTASSDTFTVLAADSGTGPGGIAPVPDPRSASRADAGTLPRTGNELTLLPLALGLLGLGGASLVISRRFRNEEVLP